MSRKPGLTLALLALLVPGPARGDGLTLMLTALDPGPIVQGTPLRYRAVLSNSGASSAEGDLSFELSPRGSGSPVAFADWSGTVEPGANVVLDGAVTPSQWFGQTGEFQIVAGAPEARLSFRVRKPPLEVPRFEDMTAAAGLATLHRATAGCDNYSAGAAWGDADGDGDLDLYLPHQEAPAQLFVNEGGLFVERAAQAGVDNAGSVGVAAVFADMENDGDQDLYVVNDGPNRLYRNEGSGIFSEVSGSAGVADPGPGSSAAWGDYDRDGYLDLYVVNYGRCEEDVVYPDVLYHNEGNGSFTDRTSLLPPRGETEGLGFQAAWVDCDGDGDSDLYLANDHIRPFDQPNVLWRNDGPGLTGWRFTDISAESGAGVAVNSMGIGIGDYDRDGNLDFAVSNMGPTVLLHSNGDGTFTDVAEDAGVARPEQRAGVMAVTWGLSFSDLNNDGWEDLYVAAGSLLRDGDPLEQPNAVFANAGDGTFLDLSAPSGAADPGVSRGTALADYDRDGRVDIYVVNQTGAPRLYRNVTPARGGHWLEVETVGTVSNRDGCGARLVAEIGNARLVREVLCGSTGLGTGSDPTVHFGLGHHASVRTLTIIWPSGLRQSFRHVRADRLITLTEAVPELVAPDLSRLPLGR